MDFNNLHSFPHIATKSNISEGIAPSRYEVAKEAYRRNKVEKIISETKGERKEALQSNRQLITILKRVAAQFFKAWRSDFEIAPKSHGS